jgi:hypothetical protein
MTHNRGIPGLVAGHHPATGTGQLERTTPLVWFPGVVNWVQIETGKADNRHLISPEDRWRGRHGPAVTPARQ